jgi:hypothetical protein
MNKLTIASSNAQPTASSTKSALHLVGKPDLITHGAINEPRKTPLLQKIQDKPKW